MIAEDCVDAERRLETGKLGRPGGMRHPFDNKAMGGEIAAQDHQQIGAERYAGIDHLVHTLVMQFKRLSPPEVPISCSKLLHTAVSSVRF